MGSSDLFLFILKASISSSVGSLKLLMLARLLYGRFLSSIFNRRSASLSCWACSLIACNSNEILWRKTWCKEIRIFPRGKGLGWLARKWVSNQAWHVYDMCNYTHTKIKGKDNELSNTCQPWKNHKQYKTIFGWSMWKSVCSQNNEHNRRDVSWLG